MHVAAIDIGSNSLHMAVVRIRPDLSFEVVAREKEMVRLGAGGLDGAPLTADAICRALQVMSSFRRIADSHRVDEVVAVATSAVREAENGEEFLRMILRETGIRARVIAGSEEAALIHRAAIHGVGGADVSVVVDIGGGSVEISRGLLTPDVGYSLKLGVIRLTERFVRSEPLLDHDERRLVRCIDREVGDAIAHVARDGFSRLIATSGTALSLGAVIAAEGRTPDAPLRHRRIAAHEITGLRRRLTALPLEGRLQVRGLDPKRADLAVAGVILLDEIVRRLGASELTLCDLSLREGLILDYIERHRQQIAHVDQFREVRRRSILELAGRCGYRAAHAHHVARLALLLFDQTRHLHGLTDREREWLEYAALLHDVGAHISYERHHKHSYYLIRNGGLRGFEPTEIEIVALAARYHRRKTPSASDDGFRGLSREHRHAVRVLGAMLRLAETLDRSHAQVVTGFVFDDRGEAEATLRLETAAHGELEIGVAMRECAPFEGVIGKPLRFELSPGGLVRSA
jgi:exopolyphosphatase/guanosine-5'-triphosphate,3'-diphosphate pyrophosphatase